MNQIQGLEDVVNRRGLMGHLTTWSIVAPRRAVTALAFMLVLCAASGAQGITQRVMAQEGQPAAGNDDEFSAHGFNVVRIEQEDKITVPREQYDEVWQYLKDYLIDDTTALKKLDPQLTSFAYEEYFIDEYYDTPSLQMLARQSSVRHRRRANLTNPDDRKNGRELMQIKLNDISDNELNRGEIKFEIEYPEKIVHPEDAHPLLGIVKPGHRKDLKQRLAEFGVDPYAMRPVLTVKDIRRRIYVRRNGQPFLSVSLDNASSDIMWAKWRFVEIEPELNEIPFTEGDAATQQHMVEVNTAIIGALMTKFPNLKRDLTPKYNKAFNYAASRIPLYRFLVMANMDDVGSVALVGVLGLATVVGVSVVGVRNKRRP